jgi:hypothetical protein
MRLGLFERRTVWFPTKRGWLALLGLSAAALFLIVSQLYPFLAVNQPVAADLLIVEGWVPDEVLDQAIQEYRQGHYRQIVTTGCPIEKGSYTLPYQTYPEMTLAALKKLGFTDQNAKAVPASKVIKDRTYQSARALRRWLADNGSKVKSINVATHSCHARRTRLLFEKAFHNEIVVGILAYDVETYNAHNWWKCSAGVRDAVGELIAYAYARLIFRPPEED